MSPAYLKKLLSEFTSNVKKNEDPFFPPKKKGPKKRFTDEVKSREAV